MSEEVGGDPEQDPVMQALDFPGDSDGQEPTCNVGTQVQSLDRQDPLATEDPLATHSSILAWRIPWTKEPGGQ